MNLGEAKIAVRASCYLCQHLLTRICCGRDASCGKHGRDSDATSEHRGRQIHVVMSSRRHVVMPSCCRVVTSSCHVVTSRRHVVMPSCRRVVMSSCRHVVRSSRRHVVTSRRHVTSSRRHVVTGIGDRNSKQIV
jgi:hypothetical protein